MQPMQLTDSTPAVSVNAISAGELLLFFSSCCSVAVVAFLSRAFVYCRSTGVFEAGSMSIACDAAGWNSVLL